MKLPEGKMNTASIIASLSASATSIYTGDYFTAGWATFTAIAVYRFDLQKQETKKWKNIQLNIKDFLSRGEVEEIKDLLKRLDSWSVKEE